MGFTKSRVSSMTLMMNEALHAADERPSLCHVLDEDLTRYKDASGIACLQLLTGAHLAGLVLFRCVRNAIIGTSLQHHQTFRDTVD